MTERTQDRKEFLHNIFTNALEGGIGYWSCTSKYHIWKDPEAHWSRLVQDLDGFQAVIEPSDGEWGVFDERAKEVGPLTIDIYVIETGITRFVEWLGGKRGQFGQSVDVDRGDVPLRAQGTFNPYWDQFLRQNETNGEDGDSDAEVADAIVQLGLFDEVVYG